MHLEGFDKGMSVLSEDCEIQALLELSDQGSSSGSRVSYIL